MAAPAEDVGGRAAAAMLALAAQRPWRDLALRDIAAEAGVSLADLYAVAPSKAALLARLSRAYDLAAVAAAAEAANGAPEDVHDRLFEAVMARIEAMEADRQALIAMARELPALALAPHFPFTARALLEAAGVEATPPRVVAVAALWARVVQVWRDDEGALNRTMAEIDQRLKQARQALSRLGAGW